MERRMISLTIPQGGCNLSQLYGHIHSVAITFSNESQSTISQWLQYHDRYLDILLEMEGHPSSPCLICSARCADIKCSDCCGANIFCKVCCPNVHKRSPFH